MSSFDKKSHWENIYNTKALDSVSWYQPTPSTSLSYVEKTNLALTDKLIDVGGGDSFLVDHLLDLGYSDITVLDISEKALERAKERLGEKASSVHWEVSDASQFITDHKFDFWHDRAAFHFLTEKEDVENYKKVVASAIKPGGTMVIGTFSENGPLKCSGIPIQQYSIQKLEETFKDDFELISSETIDHKTPFDTIQNFVFCAFKRK